MNKRNGILRVTAEFNVSSLEFNCSREHKTAMKTRQSSPQFSSGCWSRCYVIEGAYRGKGGAAINPSQQTAVQAALT